jgi:hypothetical protein
MEPLHPSDREALKRVHPGLTDDEINRTEELISRIDAEDEFGHSEEAEDMRLELSRFIRDHIPRYGDVMRDVAASRRDQLAARRTAPRVFHKRSQTGQ